MTAGISIVGTDTEVGKTFIASKLARSLCQRGMRVGVYKPVSSGTAASVAGDAEILHQAVGRAYSLDRICPQQFLAPVAPPIAAQMEDAKVDEQLLISGFHWWKGKCDFLIVEGVGGVLSPISSTMTVLDFVSTIRQPIALVAANRLGVVNHTLLSLQALQSCELDVRAVLLNSIPSQAKGPTPDLSTNSNHDLLAQFTDVTIVTSVEQLQACL